MESGVNEKSIIVNFLWSDEHREKTNVKLLLKYGNFYQETKRKNNNPTDNCEWVGGFLMPPGDGLL
jgi:hypothetical protein